MHLPVFAHALVWLENGNNQSRAENHHLGNVRHESEGQVQEEMKKLKIINRSGVTIRLAELVAGIQIGEIIIIALDREKFFPCNRYLDDKSIRLDIPPNYSVDRRCIHLNGDFMDANKIAYVRKGDGDCWFVDPIRRGAKLVRKCVCNSTPSQIAVVEIVSERKGETKGVPGRTEHPPGTAWWEIEIPSRTKNLLIVDPEAVVKHHRTYFGRKRGPPHWEIEMLREMASDFEHVAVKQESPSGSLELTYRRGLRFWL